jgi:hypothetical protein
MQKKVIAKKGAITKIICFHSKTVLLVLFVRLLGSGWGWVVKSKLKSFVFIKKNSLTSFMSHLALDRLQKRSSIIIQSYLFW